MNRADVMHMLRPIFELSAVDCWNAPSQDKLAELILPRTAADLTVRELLALMAQVPA